MTEINRERPFCKVQMGKKDNKKERRGKGEQLRYDRLRPGTGGGSFYRGTSGLWKTLRRSPGGGSGTGVIKVIPYDHTKELEIYPT